MRYEDSVDMINRRQSPVPEVSQGLGGHLR